MAGEIYEQTLDVKTVSTSGSLIKLEGGLYDFLLWSVILLLGTL